MKKWEYKILNLNSKGVTNLVLSKEDEIKINELGQIGWELVTATPTVNGRNICCIFKKEVLE